MCTLVVLPLSPFPPSLGHPHSSDRRQLPPCANVFSSYTIALLQHQLKNPHLKTMIAEAKILLRIHLLAPALESQALLAVSSQTATCLLLRRSQNHRPVKGGAMDGIGGKR
uniref:Uncharacterized protein n=1 Tax=Ditylenchus dipsaci TaxID=166011 RepID=A0A915E152_9BILA